jgi:hypothetical protein
VHNAARARDNLRAVRLQRLSSADTARQARHASKGLSRFARALVARHESIATPLERTLIPDLLCAVRRARILSGITTGIIPAAATTGMLLGFGIRLGAPSRVFYTIGMIVAGANAADGPRTSTLVAILGFVLQLVATLSCGVAYVSLIGDSGDHRVAWAITIGAAAMAAVFVCARTFAGPIALVLTPGNLFAIGVVIAITLPIGTRFAPSRV